MTKTTMMLIFFVLRKLESPVLITRVCSLFWDKLPSKKTLPCFWYQSRSPGVLLILILFLVFIILLGGWSCCQEGISRRDRQLGKNPQRTIQGFEAQVSKARLHFVLATDHTILNVEFLVVLIETMKILPSFYDWQRKKTIIIFFFSFINYCLAKHQFFLVWPK
jgi:hypothetical protein